MNYDTVESFWERQDLSHYLKPICEPHHFVNRFSSYIGGGSQCLPVSRANAGLRFVLQEEALKKEQPVGKVLVCAFNCPSTIETILASGFDVDAFDLDQPNGRVDWEHVSKRLDPQRYLAVIVTHYYGVPAPCSSFIQKAQDMGIPVIEDSAHCLGGEIDGRIAGTLGQYGLFSFNYDKPISLGGGGMVSVNSVARLAAMPESHDIDYAQEFEELKSIASKLAWRRFKIDKSFGLMARLIGGIERISIRNDHIDEAIQVGPARSSLGCMALDKYAAILEVRNANADRIGRVASQSWFAHPSVKPAWLRQRLLAKSRDKVDMVIRNMRRHGLRVGQHNWPRLHPIFDQSHFPAAAEAVALGVDFPVHQNLPESALRRLEDGAAQL